ncbi:hypothetical protein Bca52824_049679 [Brassica carinata]|uniref:Reverse transcriptase zinc-binding domain-containing protein n=1 Tax=Brassica carinata TaxID=52824 RepID=A0A8X7RKU8_BRACI|nr:hypothetical protein Bca52824_049679 [Brassica carinata]
MIEIGALENRIAPFGFLSANTGCMYTAIYLHCDYEPILPEERMVAHSSRSPLTQNSIAGEQRKTLMSTERKTISEKRYLAAPQEGVMETYQEKSNQGKGGSSYHPFQERVDRHGNAFGERISTKQTRNPPPETNTITLDNSNLTWRQKAAQEKGKIYSSPAYVKERDQAARSIRRGRDLFPQRSTSQWRPKRSGEQEVNSTLAPAPAEPNREQNAPKNNAQMGTHKERLATEKPSQEFLFPDPSLIRSPQGGEDVEEDIGMDPYYSDISPRTEAALLNKRKENAARIRSLIVSASMEPRVSRGLSQRPPAKPQAEEEKEETLQEFQNKVRRGTSRSSKRRSPRSSPNVLLGASLKKRRLSQIQNSPNRGKTGGESSARGAKKNGKAPVISGNKNFIDTIITQKGVTFQITFVYGEPDHTKRLEVWNEISTLKPASGQPWFLTGDFNEITENSEKKGGPERAEGTFCAFRSFLSENDLFDIKHYGNFLSWRGKRNTHMVQCRLDRAISNSDWMEVFPSCRSQYLKYEASDHRPLLTFLDTRRKKGLKIFRFDRRLKDHIEVKLIIREVWERTTHLDVGGRLACCRRAICEWSKEFQANSRKMIETLRIQLDDAMSNPVHDDDLIHRINMQLLTAYKQEEEYWKQRSRQLWLALGDSNTSYFHATTKARKSKNRMTVIENDAGVPWFEEEQIANVICKYYDNLFKANQTTDLHIVEEALRPCRIQEHIADAFDWIKDIWNAKCSPKVQLFMWSIIQEAVPLGENLRRRGIQSEALCIRCKGTESAMHIFFNCPFAQEVWKLIPLRQVVHLATETDFKKAVIACRRLTCLPPTGVSTTILPWMCWVLWTARNTLLFEKRTLTPEETATKAVRLAREWINAQPQKTPTTQGLTQARRTHRIQTTEDAIPTCKSDAAFDAESKKAGLAWIIREESGTTISQGSKPQGSVNSPLIAEALALRVGTIDAVKLGLSKLRMLSDNSTLIRAINNDAQVKEIFGIVKDIQELSSVFVEISFAHIRRLTSLVSSIFHSLGSYNHHATCTLSIGTRYYILLHFDSRFGGISFLNRIEPVTTCILPSSFFVGFFILSALVFYLRLR